MKNLYTKTLKLLILGLIIVGFSACTSEPQYIYCNDSTITIYNDTEKVVYYSWRSSYCDEVLLPGESRTFHFGEVESNLDRPEANLFDYKFTYPGYSNYSVNIAVDNCNKEFVIY